MAVMEPFLSRRSSPDASHKNNQNGTGANPWRPKANSQPARTQARCPGWKKLADKYQLPGVNVEALVDWQRKDMEALAEANRQAFEGMKALIDRRNQILQETLAQWQSTVKDASSAKAASKVN